jgi:hypothetical protein
MNMLLISEHKRAASIHSERSEHMKKMFSPMNVERVLNASTIYV